MSDELLIMMKRFEAMKFTLNDPSTAELEIPSDISPNMEQLGLQHAMIDELGRIWIQRDQTLRMIFDPAWLHPSKRWDGPRQEREVPKTRSPR